MFILDKTSSQKPYLCEYKYKCTKWRITVEHHIEQAITEFWWKALKICSKFFKTNQKIRPTIIFASKQKFLLSTKHSTRLSMLFFWSNCFQMYRVGIYVDSIFTNTPKWTGQTNIRIKIKKNILKRITLFWKLPPKRQWQSYFDSQVLLWVLRCQIQHGINTAKYLFV